MKKVIFLIGSILFFTWNGIAQFQPEKLTFSEVGSNFHFGYDVAVSGNSMIVGAPGLDESIFHRTFILEETTNGWEVQKIFLPDVNSTASTGWDYGWSVDIDGNRAIVGQGNGDRDGPNVGFGLAYLYEKVGGIWEFKNKIFPYNYDDPNTFLFGNDVAISGSYAVIGALGGESGPSLNQSGAAFVYKEEGGVWSLDTQLFPSDISDEDRFGFEVAIEGDVIIVAARKQEEATHNGAVYVFRKIGNEWIEEAKLTASEGIIAREFGYKIAIDQSNIAVLSISSTPQFGSEPGRVYLFEYQNGTWNETNILHPKETVGTGVYGGRSLDMKGNFIAIGDEFNRIPDSTGSSMNISSAGAAILFEKKNGVWEEYPDFLFAPIPQVDAHLGKSLALGDDRLFVGAYNYDENGSSNSGAVYSFDLVETIIPPSDCQGITLPTSTFTELGEHNGSKYYISNTDAQPAAAQAVAQQNGGYLVVINDQAENDFIQQNISEMAYIGLNDVQTEGTLVWDNDDPLNYNNINPCGFCNENTSDLDYVIMAPWNGAWSFSSQWNSRKYIVEIPCDNTGGGTPDLTLSNVTGVSSSGEVGDAIDLVFDLNNIGTGAVMGDFVIAAYLSTDDLFDGSDIYLADLTTGNTPIGTESGLQLSFNIPTTSDGNYYIIIIADVNGNVIELNSNNNGIEVPIEILMETGGDCPPDISGFTTLGEHNGSKYFISDGTSQPAAAQAVAQQNNGYLAVINDQAENDFIQQNISEMVYIGLNDVQTEGTIVWENGDPLNYNNINPCGFCEENSADLDYVIMAPWDGTWSFSSQWNSRKYIVEVSCGTTPLCPCPTIYDPVCGDDGVTYPNGCEAECAGIFNYTLGECPTAPCDTFTTIIDAVSDFSCVQELADGNISAIINSGGMLIEKIISPAGSVLSSNPISVNSNSYSIENGAIVEKDSSGNVLITIPLDNSIVTQFSPNGVNNNGFGPVVKSLNNTYWVSAYERSEIVSSGFGEDTIYAIKVNSNGNLISQNLLEVVSFGYLLQPHLVNMIATPDGGARLFRRTSLGQDLRILVEMTISPIGELNGTSGLGSVGSWSITKAHCELDRYKFNISNSPFPVISGTSSFFSHQYERKYFDSTYENFYSVRITNSADGNNGTSNKLTESDFYSDDGSKISLYRQYDTHVVNGVTADIYYLRKYDVNNNLEWEIEPNLNYIPEFILEDSNGSLIFFDLENSALTVSRIDCEPTSTNQCTDNISGFTLLGEFGNSVYFISDGTSQPAAAQAVAQQNGGYLAVINDQAENDFIQQNISEMVYIGLNDVQTEGTLVWENGDPLNYNNINPCSFCNENAADLDYVIMAPWDGDWSFSSQWNSRKYVVEVPCTATSNSGFNNVLINQFSNTFEDPNQTILQKVYPNPTMQNAFVTIYSPIEQEVEIQIIDARGGLARTFKMSLEKGENTKGLRIEDLRGGFYTIYIPQAQSKNSAIRFVKVRD